MTRIRRAISPGAILGCFLLAGMLVSACGSDNPSGDDDESTGSVDPFGTFQVSLVAPQGTTPGFTAVLGRMQDGPTPSAIVWEEAAVSGDCRLLTPRVPFCEQPCGGGALCVEDGVCQPFATPIDVGTVRVDGLRTLDGETAFSMEAIAFNYQPPGGAPLAFPAFAVGGDITFTASGNSTVSSFAVTARGISPLQIANETIALDGEPVLLEWTPSALAGVTTISVAFDISYHGGTKGRVECECPDSGSLEVSASLLEQLKALGISGFPKIEVSRRATGSTDAPAQVHLVVESMVTKIPAIPGVISCNGDADCPSGQSCQPDFRCR